MDPRIREHAAVIVDWSARIEPGDRVLMQVDEGSIPLGIAVAEEVATREASLVTTFGSGEIERAYLKHFPTTDFPVDPEHHLALLEQSDVFLRLRGGTNTSAMADVPTELQQAASIATSGIREARMATDWVSTIHPTPSLAQQASMATEEYRDFAYEAILYDWEALAEEMAQLKNRLDEGETVRIETETTELTMQIDGCTAVNSAASVAYDSHNLPSGEVFTAPYGTEGTVTFDIPMTINSKPVRDVRLEFEDGVVVDATAAEGLDVIEGVLETDAGAKRLGELGIGMNRAIDRYTNNILFDEKMGGTFHLALGRAYDSCLPEGETGNKSAVHVDLLANFGEGSTMTIDDEVVQSDGRFVWET